MLKKLGIGLAALRTIASGVYLLFIRPWHLRWGATGEEVHRPLPGDDLVPYPLLAAPDHLGETASREDFVQDSDGSERTLSEPG